ncbi:MAG: FAD-binding protein [Alphaproteobacteria bacterium]|nr:FAD-binding protein [Alphaproteobacteria bacterium]MCB9792906.1 FAD-binding protein [Alphaproteobacteria bacterium]
MRPDALIVGAGTAGAAAAWQLARRGLRVLCVDAKPLERAGARWVNGVAAWAFDEAGVPRPEPPERLAEGVPFHMVAGWGPERVCITDHDLMEVDMVRLVARLQGMAAEAGVELRGGVRVLGFDGEVLETNIGPLRAGLFVDASGLNGARLLGAPPVPRARLCAAAQHLRRVNDLQAAAGFFAQHGVQPGETLCFTGVAGGYSILNLRLDGEHLAVLTGSVPAAGHAAGVKIAEDFARAQPWVGEAIAGGARAIPLRHALTVIGRGRVAAIGDAACQVHGAHGSGIAQGLIAGRVLAEAVASEGGPEAYNRDWQRRWGGPLASAAVFCRFSQTLEPEALRRLMGSGAMGPRLSRAVLTQRPPIDGLLDLPVAGLALARSPALARRLLPVLGRMGAAELHYTRYPRDPARLSAWEARLERILGD